MTLLLIILASLVIWNASTFFFPEWHERRVYNLTIKDTKWNRSGEG